MNEFKVVRIYNVHFLTSEEHSFKKIIGKLTIWKLRTEFFVAETHKKSTSMTGLRSQIQTNEKWQSWCIFNVRIIVQLFKITDTINSFQLPQFIIQHNINCVICTSSAISPRNIVYTLNRSVLHKTSKIHNFWFFWCKTKRVKTHPSVQLSYK